MTKFLTFAVLLCSAAALAQTNALPPTESIMIDGYAAKVNDRVITRGEVHEAMAPLMPELYRLYQGDELDAELEKAFNQSRDELIERTLILEAFQSKGGEIPDQYVNDEIKRVINDRFKGDEALFEQVLADQKKTRTEYQQMIREQMIVGMMINEEVSQRARITPEQIRSEYDLHKENYFIPEKVKYSVIVVNKGETPEDQTVKMEEARRIRQKLMEGADFAETAKETSEGSRAADGGSFPWMQPKDVREELRDTLISLPAGEISEIIDTELQLYIVKVEGRRQMGYTPFEEVRDQIKNALTARERARLRNRWIERLKKQNYVRTYE
jgi:peptidyl-prolyl cis-trans isomerase SurA